MTQTAPENPTTTPDAAAPIAICVIGAGHLGQHQVRLFSSMEGVRLQGVVDVDLDRARNFASKYCTEVFSHFEMIPAATQATVVSTPAPTHFAITRSLMEKEIHCFVEKPFMETLEEAEILIRLA